ncbi:uncharacterized protein DS421_7g209180 [Arachis hypogaea]|nr:uncharacterized protein DS421_7g209180 [Arachis hypogaea]
MASPPVVPPVCRNLFTAIIFCSYCLCFTSGRPSRSAHCVFSSVTIFSDSFSRALCFQIRTLLSCYRSVLPSDTIFLYNLIFLFV